MFNPLTVKILSWGYNRKDARSCDRLHAHDHWQMELIIGGVPSMECDRKLIRLKPGQNLIIPPEIKHRYHYPETTIENWTVKFQLPRKLFHDSPVLAVPDTPVNKITLQALVELLQNAKAVAGSTAPVQVYAAEDCREDMLRLAERLMAVIMENSLSAENSNYTEPAFIREIRKLIRQHQGRKISVGTAAKHAGVSPGHLSVLFKKHLGMSLKTFIDRERAETAKNLLAYSEMNISEVSDRMGFRDVFYFSNFFKRLTGESPSTFLKNCK